MNIGVRLYPFIETPFFIIGVLRREAGLYMRQVGFLCNSGLVINVDDEMLLLRYDNTNNRFVDASRFEGGISDKCDEVNIDIEEQYSVKYLPRVYYTIFRLGFNGNIGYLLEVFDGTSGLAWFYTCNDYKKCKDLIEMFEES